MRENNSSHQFCNAQEFLGIILRLASQLGADVG